MATLTVPVNAANMSQKYRALQPAPGGSDAGPQRVIRPKRGNVSQACENCRQSKVKVSPAVVGQGLDTLL